MSSFFPGGRFWYENELDAKTTSTVSTLYAEGRGHGGKSKCDAAGAYGMGWRIRHGLAEPKGWVEYNPNETFVTHHNTSRQCTYWAPRTGSHRSAAGPSCAGSRPACISLKWPGNGTTVCMHVCTHACVHASYACIICVHVCACMHAYACGACVRARGAVDGLNGLPPLTCIGASNHHHQWPPPPGRLRE